MIDARTRCAQWAVHLWDEGCVPQAERKRLSVILWRIANGKDPRDALGVRTAGRPRKMSFDAIWSDSPSCGDDDLWFEMAGKPMRLAAAEAMTVAFKGDVEQAKWILGFMALCIEEGRVLPAAWSRFLAVAMQAIAEGHDSRRVLLLVGERGNRANPLRDRQITRLAEFMGDNSAAEIAADVGLTQRKGRRHELSSERIRDILLSVKKVPE